MFELHAIRQVRDRRTILAIDALTIPTDALTVILGHNGSGKSTLVGLLSGQQAPDQGAVTLNGTSLTRYRPRALAQQVAFLPQKLPPCAGLSVRELVKLGRFPWRGMLGRRRAQDEAQVEDAMTQTGVGALADTLVDRLSGGERQRAWVAMLLAQQAPVLILDEPTSALDVQHQYQLLTLLQRLNQTRGVGVIAILHDLNLALRYATHIVALQAGRIAFAGPAELLQDEARLSALYQTPIRLIDHPDPAQAGAQKVAVVCA